MRHYVVAIGFAAVALACSSTSSGTAAGSGVAIDTAKVCAKLIDECKQPLTQAQCEATFGILRVSQDCATKFDSATCAEISQNGSDFDETCFPNCTAPDTQNCNGDGTITICSKEGRSLTADCAATCQKATNPPTTFSGTCGKTFGAQTSDKDKCWCQ